MRGSFKNGWKFHKRGWVPIKLTRQFGGDLDKVKENVFFSLEKFIFKSKYSKLLYLETTSFF
jgi:hypothetical protein